MGPYEICQIWTPQYCEIDDKSKNLPVSVIQPDRMGELNIHEIDKYKRGFRDVRKLKMSRQKQREQEKIENLKKESIHTN